ncbi:biotin/lipoyl-containing protein [Bradyrhizobium tunisiense]|uniref:biotin/lipoyl-containing protein n=1 Tax=Bradyrhizobium tunisiense TaxID=3278709 RepID=UPI0035E36B98
MPFQHVDQLSSWLAEAGIDYLELSGPGRELRLGRAFQPGLQAKATVATPAVSHAVRTPMVGTLLHSHPMRRVPLAPCGSLVRAGQAIALLQVGALLVPIDAPCDGVVVEVVAEEGALVGFGAEIARLSDIASEA